MLMSNAEQIEEACGNIEQALAAFGGNAERVSEIGRCLEAVSWLREQYRADRALVELHLPRIKELTRRVHEAIAAARESLAAKYLQALGAVAAWEGIREACRDALAELAGAENLDRLDCQQGWIEIKHFRSVAMPRAGSPQREELAALITQAGRWADVGSPNGQRLLKAIDGGLFTPQQAGQLARLCPVQNGCRLVGHAAGQ